VGGGPDTAWTVSVVAGGVKAGTRFAGLGTGQSLKVPVLLTDDSGRPVGPAAGLRWSSSAPAVAQVDGDGNITAAGFGRAHVIAASPWGKSDTITVLVQGELLVTSTRGGTPDIYALDRKAPTSFNRLTNFPSNEVGASYGPGGTTVLFVSSKDGNQEIYAIDADGTNPRRLTNTPAQEDSPEWTPDGKQIVYASNASGTYQIWVMNADGSNQKRLTDGPAFNFQPAVSPDGNTIAFTTTRESNYDVYLMNLDGTNQRAALKSPGKETIPQWFPDGQLAFLQEQRTTNRNQPLASVVVRRDGSTGQLVSLTPTNLVVTDFAVSAQGDLLALIVSSAGQGGNMSSRLYLSPATPGAPPTEVPLLAPSEQVFSPAFRR
jgi:Tol biopolymer transport system component